MEILVSWHPTPPMGVLTRSCALTLNRARNHGKTPFGRRHVTLEAHRDLGSSTFPSSEVARGFSSLDGRTALATSRPLTEKQAATLFGLPVGIGQRSRRNGNRLTEDAFALAVMVGPPFRA